MRNTSGIDYNDFIGRDVIYHSVGDIPAKIVGVDNNDESEVRLILFNWDGSTSGAQGVPHDPGVPGGFSWPGEKAKPQPVLEDA
jgi:hypothetical protein